MKLNDTEITFEVQIEESVKNISDLVLAGITKPESEIEKLYTFSVDMILVDPDRSDIHVRKPILPKSKEYDSYESAANAATEFIELSKAEISKANTEE